jgi:hypothetical protein
MVFPAVHVLVVQANDRLSELFDEELGDAGLPGTGWAVQQSWIRSVSFRDWVENAGQVVDFGVPVLHLPWDELRL